MCVVWSSNDPAGVATSADSSRSGHATETPADAEANGKRAAIINPSRRGPFASHVGATENESRERVMPLADMWRVRGSSYRGGTLAPGPDSPTVTTWDCCVCSAPFMLQISLIAFPSRMDSDDSPTFERRSDLHSVKLSASSHVMTRHRYGGTVIVTVLVSSCVCE